MARSRAHTRMRPNRLTLALLASAATALPPMATAAGPVVALHERGKRVRLEGEPAAEIARLCETIVRQAYDGSGEPPPTDLIRSLRRDEVAVEVRFDEPRQLELSSASAWARPQYLLIPLSGPFTGAGGNQATIFAGRAPHIGAAEPPGLEAADVVDEYGIQYVAVYHARDALGPLRRALRHRPSD